ncbi:MAG: type VI secretion system-associated FHA domain protein TagH [Aquabacterium sp.]|uniref:type VI secretion system-associated FHA domain protein TagH n=1 Tax=Aquabacterium sp. TaxID=1872578 RepID=UPI0025BC18E8|nr:type VI secretion system-associated FHA domain protein TagH [Aquabacterium sp.]MBI3380489.1 type VI secretion system-associated FHA domain protein TagH [Aquabacterium sp.]
MHLLIRAVSLAGQPLTQAISAYFDERGGTIGRSDTNTLALPDPERRISRLQAEVSRGPEGWRILNVGNANPIWHNNKPVPPGEGVLLDENDELQIGTYALLVNYSQNDATARTITKGRAAVDSRTVIVGSGQEPRTDPSLMRAAEHGTGVQAPVAAPAPAPAFAPAPTPPSSNASPFADLLGGLSGASSVAGAPVAPAFVPAPSPSPASPFADLLGGFGSPAPAPAPSAPAPATPARLPDDFDPFADLQSAPTPSGRPAAAASTWDLPQAPTPPASASPFDLSPGAKPLPGDLDLMGSVAPPGAQSIDQMFGLGGGASSDPLASFLKKTEPAAPAQAAAGTPISMDPLSLIKPRADISTSAPDKPPVDAGSAFPDDVPELQAAMPLPPVASPKPAAPPEPLEASFSFMPQPKAADKIADKAPGKAEASGASPFADLGLGTPARSGGLLDDLDLSPQTVPSVHVKKAIDVSAPVGHEPLVEPLQTQLPIPQTAVPHVEVKVPEPVPAVAPAPAPATASASAATTSAALTNPAASAGTQAGTQADTQALWAAFCEGAGIHFTPPQGLNPDLMRVIGQLLHHTVDGSLKLVAARAATKQEMRAEVTVIQARRNNPLKFSPDTVSAMEQLLQPPLRGFMSGPEAVADAMDDLLGHTIGTMVGMRAALEGVLARFEPDALEAKLVGRSMLDSLLPMNRRAKLWELYLQHYDAVKAEAQDDFHNLFGRAFLQAYEEQLDRLDAERRQTGRDPAKPA